MSNKVKVAIISAISSIVVALISYVGGTNKGEQEAMNQVNSKIINIVGYNPTITDIEQLLVSYEDLQEKQQENEEKIKEINSQIVMLNKDNNVDDINSIKELTDSYIELQKELGLLKNKNNEYFNEITDMKVQIQEKDIEIEALKVQAKDLPVLTFYDLGLCVDGQDILISTTNSKVNIDGKDYFSKELIEKLIGENKSFTIKNGIIYVGKIIAEKSKLADQWTMESFLYNKADSVVDSYGHTRTNVIYFNLDKYGSRNAFVKYNLENKYNYLDITVSVPSGIESDSSGVLIIKADDNVIYTSDKILLTTNSFIVDNIPINNCSLLTISYNFSGRSGCIISDAIVYN